MKKQGAIHKVDLALPVTILKEDVKAELIKDKNTGVESLLDGTLLKAKDTKDFRKDGVFAVLIDGGVEKAQGVLVNTVEFKPNETQAVGTVMLEGIVYLDKLPKKEHQNKEKLDNGLRYIYKNRG